MMRLPMPLIGLANRGLAFDIRRARSSNSMVSGTVSFIYVPQTFVLVPKEKLEALASTFTGSISTTSSKPKAKAVKYLGKQLWQPMNALIVFCFLEIVLRVYEFVA